jgi:hypothetical protein
MAKKTLDLSTIDPAELQRQYGALLGKRFGSKGGKKRAETLTARQRKEIARKAAKARWEKSAKP